MIVRVGAVEVSRYTLPVRPLWIREGSGKGSAFLHTPSGARVVHCGHPTAAWPWYIDDGGGAIVAPTGRGWRRLAEAKAALEDLSAGLAFVALVDGRRVAEHVYAHRPAWDPRPPRFFSETSRTAAGGQPCITFSGSAKATEAAETHGAEL